MKAFTSIEQSKTLAKILPIESADMWYAEVYEGKIVGYDYIVSDTPYYSLSFVKPSENNYSQNTVKDIPAWSLAALLDVIPKEVKIKGQMYAPCLFPITDGHWLYRLWYNSNEIIESPIAVWCDNPLDACYEMILKLHKEKLL